MEAFLSFLVGLAQNVWRSESEPLPDLRNMRLKPDNTPHNAIMIQFFTWDARHPDMSWWKHFESEIPHLAEWGVTQVWLPPPHKAMNKNGQGYDAYDLWDLGEFNQKGTIRTRWGSKDELVQAIAIANKHGVDVLIDAVLNHKLGGDRPETFHAVPVDPRNRMRELTPAREIEGWTAFDFPGRAGKYSSLKWTYEHFTGLDWDHRRRMKGVYRITSPKHKGWAKNVDKELGNYDYLLGIDIDYRHPDVRADTLKWGTWVLETTGAKGFRLDAIKHIDHTFLREFIKHTRQQLGRPDLFAVAEFWSGNVNLFLPYVRAFEGEVTFFDVPLHYRFHNASKAGARFDLRTIFDDTLVRHRPSDAITFVDNHDTQIGQALQSWVGPNFKLQAYALILLRGEGHPCVFYGDLYPNAECYDHVVARGLRRLMVARKKYAYGERADYVLDRNCIGFVRRGDARHPGCAVVLSNAPRGSGIRHTVRMNVGAGGSSFSSLMGHSGKVQTLSDGWGNFPCNAGEVEVWVRDDHLPRAPYVPGPNAQYSVP